MSGLAIVLPTVFWQASSVLLAFAIAIVTGFYAVGKLVVKQLEKRLDERFNNLEKGAAQNNVHWDSAFQSINGTLNQHERDYRTIERTFLEFKAEMPALYVRRDDWVRNQTIIESKLDGLAIKIENVTLKGQHHG